MSPSPGTGRSVVQGHLLERELQGPGQLPDRASRLGASRQVTWMVLEPGEVRKEEKTHCVSSVKL